ncbi:MAG: RodZ domain-containing protein [Anaerolineaceae bacterium]
MADTAGLKLLNARLEKGISLDEVAQQTHIRLNYLKALESDDVDSLPSRVQAKGFLRLYASYLGLNEQEMVDLWEGKSAPQPISPEPEPIQSTSEIETSAEAALEEEPESVDEEERDDYSVPPPPIVVPTVDDLPPEPEPAAPPPPTSQEIFAEIGAALRKQREALGISLADVERYTRLRVHYLTALENGDTEGLPSTVQGRGMLNNYAHFLSLDADAMLSRFADGVQARREERLALEAPQTPARSARKKPADDVKGEKGEEEKEPSPSRFAHLRRYLTADVLLGGSAILILLVFIFWGSNAVLSMNKKAQQPESSGPSIADVLLTSGAPSQAAEFAPNATGEASTPIAVEAVTAAPAVVSDSAQMTPTSSIPTSNAPLQVYVVAKARAWMRVTVDGRLTFQGRVPPGGAYTFTGSNQINLITGNAAALQVFFNQQDLGTLGLNQEVVSRVFTLEGALIPTATAQPTATTTPSPTATQIPTRTPIIPATPTQPRK